MEEKDPIDESFVPSVLSGVFKKIDFAKFELICIRCSKKSSKTIPTDTPTCISCPSCGMLHSANPNVGKNTQSN